MRPIRTKKQPQKYQAIEIKKTQSTDNQIVSPEQLGTMSIAALRQLSKKTKGKLTQRHTQLVNAQKMYRIEGFKNAKLKEDVIQTNRHCQLVRKKVALELYNKNKQTKDSPLFYNQVGLCPFELMLMDESKYQSFQSHICMVCFSDIIQETIVITLPCDHLFHKECAVQNLLYSKICPGCGVQINIADSVQNKMKNYPNNKKQKNNENLISL